MYIYTYTYIYYSELEDYFNWNNMHLSECVYR